MFKFLFLREQIERKCSYCHSLKSLKSVEIIVPLTTLILYLNRFTYDEKAKSTEKLHVPVSCPVDLSLKNERLYALNAVINHIGDSLSSGHYNIILVDKIRNILVDDLKIRYNAVFDDKISYVAVYNKTINRYF